MKSLARIALQATFVFWHLSPALASDASSAEEAAQKATDYILSKQDEYDGTWPLGERAAATLCLLARYPYRHQNLTQTVAGKKQIQLEVQSLGVDFLMTIMNAEALGLPGSPIEHIDETTLLGFFAALRGLCVDQRNYYGYDLVEECAKRYGGGRGAVGLQGGIALALCSVRRDFSAGEISKLREVRSCANCPFHVDEVSLNLLAAVCIADSYKEGSAKRALASGEVVPSLVSKLVQSQRPDGGFGGLRQTSLALQSLNRVPSNLVSDEVVRRATVRLIGYQKEDGGFGGSITHTSVALPALTGQTLADFRLLPCPQREKRRPRVSFILNDSVYSKQSQRSHFDVDEGERLLDGLKKYAKANSETFRLRLRKQFGVVYVKSLDGLGSNSNTRWQVFQIASDGSRKDVTLDFASIRVSRDSLFEFKLVF